MMNEEEAFQAMCGAVMRLSSDAVLLGDAFAAIRAYGSAAEARGAARAREEIRITIEQLERWRRDDEMERSEFGTWLYRDAVLALLRRGAGVTNHVTNSESTPESE